MLFLFLISLPQVGHSAGAAGDGLSPWHVALAVFAASLRPYLQGLHIWLSDGARLPPLPRLAAAIGL